MGLYWKALFTSTRALSYYFITQYNKPMPTDIPGKFICIFTTQINTLPIPYSYSIQPTCIIIMHEKNTATVFDKQGKKNTRQQKTTFKY